MRIRTIPTSQIDLFTDAARLDPYPRYRELRDIGPVLYLPTHDVHAVSRFAEAVAVLDNWTRYSSAKVVFMNPQLNEQLGAVIMLCLDPPEHTDVRTPMARPLQADRIREMRPRIVAEADAKVDRLVDRGNFDAATDLAEHLPMSVAADLVGLGEHGRENMLRRAASTCESRGPRNARTEAAECRRRLKTRP